MMAKLEQNKPHKSMSIIMITAVTGFFGGVFWSALGWLAYVFNFTEIRPNMILEHWTVGEWKTGWLGSIISLILIGLIGILAAFIYYFTLRKFNNIWVSLAYGIILFLLVFYLLNPLFPMLNPLKELSRNTIITMICLYSLFGVFVGYSISYEYNEQLHHNEDQTNELESKQ